MVRNRPPGICEKIEVHSDGTATLGCRGSEGQPIKQCSEASDYRNSSLPLSEQLCQWSLRNHIPHMNDEFKQPYISVCHNLDETLADPFKAGSKENLQLRFDAMERELDIMVNNPELPRGDNGRYLYHIDARILHAYLPAFWYRAEHGVESEIPGEIITDAYRRIIGVLDDFTSLYENVATQVALRRTEVEILALLLRTGKSEFFPFPTLFREDASETRHFNHDAYVINGGRKTTIQIANADYKLANGKLKSQAYSMGTVVAIHQQVVNLDYRDGETVITKVTDQPHIIEHEHDVVDDDYAHFDEQPRFVAWGATESPGDEPADFSGEYVQQIGGKRRDGLVQALVKEAKGQKLLPQDRNLLNGASHYLIAAIREKQRLDVI